jgi:hypothetical protein
MEGIELQVDPTFDNPIKAIQKLFDRHTKTHFWNRRKEVFVNPARVNLLDNETHTITVFKKPEDGTDIQFSTTTRLTKAELEDLFNSGGNFVTDNNLNTPEVFPMLKNLTNKETEK